MDLRPTILRTAQTYHSELAGQLREASRRLGNKIHVIVALNGETTYAATRSESGKWRFHSAPEPSANHVSNGDGTVLFQSSLVPGLGLDHYWALIPQQQANLHGGIMDQSEVVEGVKALLSGTNPRGLARGPDFLPTIDWSKERVEASSPQPFEDLDFLERGFVRETMPVSTKEDSLNPTGAEATVYTTINKAAIRVLKGADLPKEASRIGKSEELITDHIKTLLMPLLF
jgi:hypothetical protein